MCIKSAGSDLSDFAFYVTSVFDRDGCLSYGTGLDWTCSVCHILEVLSLLSHISGSVALNALKPSRLLEWSMLVRGLLVCRLIGAELPVDFVICVVQIILLYFELRIYQYQSITLKKHLHSFWFMNADVTGASSFAASTAVQSTGLYRQSSEVVKAAVNSFCRS